MSRLSDNLQRLGYRRDDAGIPPSKHADQFWQKKLKSQDLNIELYLNLWVYEPNDFRSELTVEFEFQIDSDKSSSDHSTRVRMFSFEDPSPGKIEEIEKKAKNLYTYIKHA